eukprot:654827-Pelagomonas_calceolata.AAC.4
MLAHVLVIHTWRSFVQVVEAADQLRARVCGNVVTHTVNRNINYTNVCTFGCGFCAFSKGKMQLACGPSALRRKPDSKYGFGQACSSVLGCFLLTQWPTPQSMRVPSHAYAHTKLTLSGSLLQCSMLQNVCACRCPYQQVT